MPEPYVTNWSRRPSWCAISVPMRYSNRRSTIWAKTDAACPALAADSVIVAVATVSGVATQITSALMPRYLPGASSTSTL